MEENQTASKEGSEILSKHSSHRHHSIASERRVGDSRTMTRGDSRRMSRLSETVTVIADCGKVPDTCVLCGNGIPYTNCLCCENQAHNRCIEAFFCTTGKKVNLDNWSCPKCVTLCHLDKESSKEEKKTKDESKANQVDMLDVPVVEIECPFCKIDMDLKNCECRECVSCLKKSLQASLCEPEHKPQMLRYNKCLQYRDFSTKIEYKYLEEEDKVENGYEEEGELQEEDGEEVEPSLKVKICWSIAWFLLLITLAFPIAIISSFIFIVVYCFEACCRCCHPVCIFFLEGIKLPGTCCRGICSGEPMCSSSDNVKEEKT